MSEKVVDGDDKVPLYNSDLKISEKEFDALGDQTALLRIVRFNVDNNSEYIVEQMGPEIVAEMKEEIGDDLGTGKFVHVDYHGDKSFIIEVYKAVKNSPDLQELFEGVYKMMQLEKSSLGGLFNKILNDEIDLDSDEGLEEIAMDIASAFMREKFGDRWKGGNRPFPKGGKVVFGDGDILEQLFGEKDGEPIPESDNCQCPICRARRAAGIPKRSDDGEK